MPPHHKCFNGTRIGRHNALRDALHSTAVSAGIGATKENRHLLPGSGRKPADIFLPYWTGGKDTAWDVTVVYPLQSSMVARAATTPGHGAHEAYRRKWRPVPAGRYSVCPPGHGEPGGLARGCHQGGQEARRCPSQTQRVGGEHGHQTPVPEAEHPPCEGKLRPHNELCPRQCTLGCRWPPITPITC